MPDTPTAQLPGVQLLEEVGRSARSVVYRARRGDFVVAVKLLRTDAGGDLEAAALTFRREAATLATLSHPCVVQVFEIGDAGGLPYVIMEYVEGRTLAARLSAGPMSETEAIQLGLQLAGALGEVHRRRLIHRDLRPQNVLFLQNASGLVKLVDFDIRLDAAPPGAAGPAAYRAPEQGGMLGRTVDARSDLYALGAMLFEAVSGRPPFLAREPDELLRQHAVLAPPPLRELAPRCSPAFAAVVARLLAKDPDDRFQSGEETAKALLAIDESIPTGPFGHVSKDKLDGPLVGREPELRRLEEAHARAREGLGGGVLVTGEPGSGKSRLLAAFAAAKADSGVPVLAVRCRAEARPLAGLRAAVDPHLRRLRPDALALAGGDGGELVSATVDALALIAEAHPGAVLWVDDAEAIDDATLAALRLLVGRVAELPLLLVAVGRFERWAGELDRDGACEFLALEALSEPAVAALMAALLGQRRVDDGLVRLVATRSGGLPLGVIEYVRAMLDGGVLRPYWDVWQVEVAGLASLHLPGDVQQLLLTRVARLSERTRDALRAAAVLGPDVQPALLARVLARDPLGVSHALAEAAAARLLERGSHGDFSFVHNRVREVLLAGLDAAGLASYHQRVAEALDVADVDGDGLHRLAHHYLAGDHSRPGRAIEVCLRAGRLAQAESADEDAYRYFRRADELRARVGLPPDPRLDEGLSEVCSRTGRHDEADVHVSRAMSQEQDPLRRAQLLRRRARVELFRLEHQRALASLASAFAEVDAAMPSRGPLALALSAVMGLLAVLIAATGAGRASPRRRPRERLLAQLYDDAVRVAYFDIRPSTLLQAVIRQRYYSERLGPSAELARAKTALGIVYAAVGRTRSARRCAAEAVAMASAVGDRRTLARVSFYAAAIHESCGDVIAAEQMLARTLADHHRWLESWGLAFTHQLLALNLWLRGHDGRALAILRRLAAELEIEGDRTTRQAMVFTHGLHAVVLAGAGRRDEALRHLDQARRGAAAFPDDRGQLANLLGLEAITLVLLNEPFVAVDDAVARLEALPLRPRQVPYHVRFAYAFVAYARLHQALAAPPAQRGPHLVRLRAALDTLTLLPAHPVLRGFLLLGRSGMSWMTGLFDHALTDLSEAEQIAFATENRWLRCEALQQRAYALCGAGRVDAGRREARAAAALAEELGWRPRAEALRKAFDLGFGDDHRGAGDGHLGDVQAARLRRHLDALLELSLASATARAFEEQARIAIDELARLLAAERCALFLCDDAGKLEFKVGRDARGGELAADFGVVRDVVEQVQSTREPVVVSGEDRGGRGRHSAMAAPLILKDRMIGIVYLDNRLVRGAFTGGDVEILCAIAGHIAIALETARAAQLEAQVVAAAQEKSALLEHATSAVGIGIAVLQPDGELARHSPILADMTSRWPSVADWWAGAARQLLLPEPRPCPHCGEMQSLGRSVADLLQGGERQVFEITFTGHFHELDLATPGHVLLVSDITPRKISEENLLRLNEELTAARDQALAASRAKSTFLANMSHELRTPLNAIIGFSEMLVEDAEHLGSRQMVTDLGKIRMSGSHLLDLISTILDLSKVETGKMQLEIVEFSLPALVARVSAMLTPMIAKNRNMLAQAIQTDLEFMTGDETKVKQILFNLLSNAAKFTQDGVITLGVEHIVDEAEGRDDILFTVTDTGIGFRPDQIDKLFQDFYQADMSTTRKYGGTGLGLAIVHRFCGLMGGEIGVASEPGIGSTFRVRLPRQLVTEPHDEAPAA
ncbi:protein kinase domain-containing protein [Nannocystis punicea]|uniref:histidine kinase n=1 Tax=Nannocystis punicea TaxID=2995304 RepID=A0ABY7H051_9BACT|nr:ATP-binding protein [Nannocystis poenicansa]WAS92510.1 ATP-binding protein [Nannocystis poenicansa]